MAVQSPCDGRRGAHERPTRANEQTPPLQGTDCVTENRKPPFGLDMDFDEALKRFGQTDPEELGMKPQKIAKLPTGNVRKELDLSQPELDLKV